MLKNEAEYREAVERVAGGRKRLADHRTRLTAAGLSGEEIKRVIDPMESFQFGLMEEVGAYERVRR